jgi:hypothetical protein
MSELLVPKEQPVFRVSRESPDPRETKEQLDLPDPQVRRV